MRHETQWNEGLSIINEILILYIFWKEMFGNWKEKLGIEEEDLRLREAWELRRKSCKELIKWRNIFIDMKG